MKLNWRPERIAFLDFETRSQAELTTARKFAQHPSTRALSCVVAVDDTYHLFGAPLNDMPFLRGMGFTGQVIHHGGPFLDADAKQKLANITEGRVIVAHNAPFDAAIWEHTEGLPEREWYDTIPPARAAGLPGGLDQLSMEVLGVGKDPGGKRIVDMCCMPRDSYPVLDSPVYSQLSRYNIVDVWRLKQIFDRVHGYGEPDVMTVDRIINDRGVPVDGVFLQTLYDLFVENKKRGDDKFETLYEVNPRSSNQMIAWLKSKGFVVEGVNKALLAKFMSDPEEAYEGDEGDYADMLATVRDVLTLRKEVVGVGIGKAKAGLSALDSDGRIRDQFVYYGAGPGRWAGRQMQFHNLPTKSVPAELTYESVSAAAREAKIPVADVLNGLLRNSVRAPAFSIADYAQVEARCVAWLADEQTMLNVFADVNKSMYVDMGEKLFGRTIHKKNDLYEYTLCKALVLGCTYGMSGAKFSFTCHNRGMAKELEIMSKAGMTADDTVKLYRRAYPRVPALWKEYGDAVMSCVRHGTPEFAGKCEFQMVGADLHCVLPSGRPIVYRNARIEPMIPAYCKMYGMPEVPIPTVVYDNMRRMKGFLYGSKICENVSQGTCRDLLARSLVHMEQDGLIPCFHVHDEAGNENDNLDRTLEIMSYQPEWARGFPVLVEGFMGHYWTKTPPKSFREASALNGKVLR